MNTSIHPRSYDDENEYKQHHRSSSQDIEDVLITTAIFMIAVTGGSEYTLITLHCIIFFIQFTTCVLIKHVISD